jgi:uncharacterized membrane protein
MSDDFSKLLQTEDEGARVVAHVVYALHLLFFYTVLMPIIGVILNYVKADEARGTWLESHYRWQVRTFWFGLLFSVVLAPLMLVPFINSLVILLWVAWWLYRNIKGWLRLSERKPMYVERPPFSPGAR